MRTPQLAAIALSLFAAACAGARPALVAADPAVRGPLLSAVSSLEGRWQGAGPYGEPGTTVFAVSSAGTAVRELMLVGSEHEMTNMYTLDGNELVLTHYCAGGNQPRMRAGAVENGRLVFRSDGVADLKQADEVYMGELTLVRVDDDHLEQHWRAFKAGELDHEMVIALERAR